jgi:hypothetical protein
MTAPIPLRRPSCRLDDRVVRGADIVTQVPPSSPLVAGLFGTASLVVIAGSPGSLKSFVALDLTMSVASGQPFHGRAVLSGPAIYVVAEGQGGIGPRVDAWLDAHGGDIGAVSWLRGAVALADSHQVADFTELTATEAPAVITFDTYGRCIPGVDENSAKDMGIVLRHLDALREASGATIVLVHHLGKDVSKGLRGSTALSAAADTILTCTRTRTGVSLHCSKQKDGVDGDVQRFALLPRRDSAVLAPSAEAEPFRPTVLMEKVSRVLEASTERLSTRTIEGIVPGKAEAKRQAIGLPGIVPGKAEAKRQAIGLLVAEGYIAVEDGPRGARLHRSARPFRNSEETSE